MPHIKIVLNNNRSYIHVLGLCVLLLMSAFLTGCQEEGCTDPEAINYNQDADKSCGGCCEYPENATVKVKMSHNIDGQPLELNKMQYSNPFGREYEVTKLRYYVSDFRFHRGDGTVYDADMYQLIDVEEDKTMTFTIPNVPSADYTKVSFYFGLDEEKNQDNALPEEETVMPWPKPLGDGYHFMQQEGFYKDSSGSKVAFNTHMGKKKVNDSTFENNHITINLANSNISVDDKTWTMDIAMNINEWYTNPNDYDFPDFGQGIMGNGQAQQTLHENGANAFTLTNKSEAN